MCMGRDKDSLEGKAEAAQARKAKQEINSLFPSAGRSLAMPRGSVMPKGDLGTQTPDVLPFLLLPQFLLLSRTPQGQEHPWGQLSPPSSV